jgi:hypothetical protein
MNTNDWQTVHQQLRDEERREGEPPTAEEVLAYSRGELPPNEEARVREALLPYPELVRAMIEPFPAEGAAPGDFDYLSDREFATHWASMQRRMQRPAARGARVVQLWRYSTAIAAGIALVFGVMLWRTTARLSDPRVVGEFQTLLPDGRRGPSEMPVLAPHGDAVLLVVPLVREQHFENYRVALLDADTHAVLWRSAELRPSDDEAFSIVVPRRFLKPGVYQVAVYGIDAVNPLSTYSLRVPR